MIGDERPRTAALLLAAGTAATGAVLARRRRSHHLARRINGAGPGVRTDDGVVLHVETGGRDDAPVTVVFAHGFAARAQEFDAQRDALGEHARLVLFDQRGHGRSGWGDYRCATIEQLGRDLGHVIDTCAGNGPVLLVAHSMGGMAAIALAGQRPELFGPRIAGVALLSTAAGRLTRVGLPDSIAGTARSTGLADAAARALWFIAPAIESLAPFRRPSGRRWMLDRLFGDDAPSPEAAHVMQDMWINTPQSVISAFYPAMVNYNRTDALDVFRNIPTLVLTGNSDSTISCQRSERLAHAIGDTARLVVIPGAGHMVNLTHPDAVNEALLELLESTRAHV
ncbi:alpha/beta fold hydrolase [Arthrobacter sp. H41]|uniref:alpha/beta fold hydrolase n=1 Tax=Arthrobacter sp. H41 TaxID=1312978 RepID=UPI0004B9AC98|nr:alpha/beta hydrolase [Arthrobacter sp. H41]